MSQWREQITAFKRALLKQTLEFCNGNRVEAAAALGLQRTLFLRMLRDHGLQDYSRGTGNGPRPPRYRRSYTVPALKRTGGA